LYLCQESETTPEDRPNLNFNTLISITYITGQPTNSMEQNPPCEANIRSASQEMSRLFWGPKFHYSFQKTAKSETPYDIS